jgi:hypothetical protein
MHGLSLVAFTLLVFGLLGYFATRTVAVRCPCHDGVTVQGTRGGLESIPARCATLCASHGGMPPPAHP